MACLDVAATSHEPLSAVDCQLYFVKLIIRVEKDQPATLRLNKSCCLDNLVGWLQGIAI